MNHRLKMQIRTMYLRQSEFAERVGKPPSSVSKIIHNKQELTKEEQKKWALILNCRVRDIF